VSIFKEGTLVRPQWTGPPNLQLAVSKLDVRGRDEGVFRRVQLHRQLGVNRKHAVSELAAIAPHVYGRSAHGAKLLEKFLEGNGGGRHLIVIGRRPFG